MTCRQCQEHHAQPRALAHCPRLVAPGCVAPRCGVASDEPLLAFETCPFPVRRRRTTLGCACTSRGSTRRQRPCSRKPCRSRSACSGRASHTCPPPRPAPPPLSLLHPPTQRSWPWWNRPHTRAAQPHTRVASGQSMAPCGCTATAAVTDVDSRCLFLLPGHMLTVDTTSLLRMSQLAGGGGHDDVMDLLTAL